MSTVAKPRQAAGSPASSGGQFKGTEHEPGGDLVAPGSSIGTSTGTSGDARPCTECETPTKRSSGLCRKCDPKSKSNRDRKPGRKAGPVKGVQVDKKSGPILDTNQPSIPLDEIAQCEFGWVPVYRGGNLVEGQTRSCAMAIRRPEGESDPKFCARHGGDTATSIGRTVSRAKAQSGRGECFPLAEEHWEQVDARLEAAQGQLANILATDTSELAKLYVEFRRQAQESSVGRFSINNQMMVLVQHAMDENKRRREAGEESPSTSIDEAVKLASEPHMTKKAWAAKGRTIDDDANGVAVVWWSPGGKVKEKEPEESEEGADGTDTSGTGERARYYSGRHGAHFQYPMSATSGDDYEVVESPLATAVPSGYGDADAAVNTMVTHGTEMGYDIELVDEMPKPGVMGYWRAHDSKIVVWKGCGGGDSRAVAHTLAHELGHATMGHSTDESKEDRSPEKEAAAESFAALVCAHHGFDASETSAQYIKDWQQTASVDLERCGTGPFLSAIEAFDRYVTATES